MIKRLFLISIFVFLSGCSKEDFQAQSITYKTPSGCEETAIPESYLARWKNGSFSQVRAKDRDSLIENFVKPNLDELSFVEQEQRLFVVLPNDTDATSFDAPPEWGQAKIEVQTAWNQNIKGSGIIVSVIDTGTELDHPLLKNNLFTNEAERTGSPQIDDDGNGYVDDVHGWNFDTNSPNVIDEEGHGTHVAGIIAGEHLGENQIGVAPNAKILPVDFMGSNGGTVSAAIKSIRYSAKMGAHIINASWGGGNCSSSLKSVIQDLEKQNILFISAAGNSGNNISYQPEYPAAYDLKNQLTVAASTQNNFLAAFSNYGPLVDLVAPGDKIYSSYVGGNYRYLSGTSMATPFVSGVAALLWSSRPAASAQDIKNAILAGVKSGFFNVKTRGLLNVSSSFLNLNQ